MDILKTNNFIIQDVLKTYPPQSFNTDWGGQAIYYYNPQVTFREVPNKISLTIPTLCYQHCSEDCNSQFCWFENWKGQKLYLDIDVLFNLIKRNEGINCLTIMTSLNFPYLNFLFRNIKKQFPNLSLALYLGVDWEELLKYYDFHRLDFSILDFIKIGKFYKNKGPLDNPNTNQRFYSINHFNGFDVFNCDNNLFLKKEL